MDKPKLDIRLRLASQIIDRIKPEEIKYLRDAFNVGASQTGMLRSWSTDKTDKNPLITTMDRINSPYPILATITEELKDFPDSLIGKIKEGDKIVELQDARINGTVRVKKEALNWWLTKGNPCDNETLASVKMLYGTDIRKNREYHQTTFNLVNPADNTFERKRIQTELPFITFHGNISDVFITLFEDFEETGSLSKEDKKVLNSVQEVIMPPIYMQNIYTKRYIYVISVIMLWQLLIVLVATAVASEDEFERDQVSNCISLIRNECVTEHAPSDDYPRNEEELEEHCKMQSDYFQCTDSVVSRCEGEVDGYVRHLRDLAANVRRVCYEDAILRAAVVENIECVGENWYQIHTCDVAFNMVRQLKRDSVAEFLNELDDFDIAEDDSQSTRCFNVLFGAGCAAATANELCGETAKNVIINILQGMNTVFEVCPPGLKEKLPEIADIVQVEVEKAESLEETLKKK